MRREPRFDLKDLHTYGGLALIGAGLAFLCWPAAVAVTGAALFYIGVWRAR